MNIPQITRPFYIIFCIVVVSLAAGLVNASAHGELRTIADLQAALKDSLVPVVLLTAGWVAFKSPWAKVVKQEFQQETTSSSVSPSGTQVIEKTKTTVSTESSESPKGDPK